MPEVLRSTKLAIESGQSQGQNEPYEPETEICASMLDAINEYVQGKERTSAEKRIVICIFVDVGEHCGDATFKYEETFVPVVLEACNDTSTDVRQAVVYRVGVCAEFRGSTFNLPTIEQS
ncbi:importin-5-like protein [Tanacetum coccineum]